MSSARAILFISVFAFSMAAPGFAQAEDCEVLFRNALAVPALPAVPSPLAGSAQFRPQESRDRLRLTIEARLQFARVSEFADIRWQGPSTTRFSDHYHQSLTSRYLRDRRQFQRSDALDQILEIYHHLGMEQAQRLITHSTQWEKIDREISKIDRLLETPERDEEILVAVAFIRINLDGLLRGDGLPARSEVSPRDAALKIGRIEWPADGTPFADSSILVNSVVNAIEQSYIMRGTEHPYAMLKEILENEMPQLYLHGRFHFQEKQVRALNQSLNTFTSIVKIDAKRPGSMRGALRLTFGQIVRVFDKTTRGEM